jgi:hypothetical protein
MMRGERVSRRREANVGTGMSPAACGRCGLAFAAQAWRELELVERIGSERIREFVTSWPDDTSVEVRRCACGRVTARKSGSR